MSLPLKKGAQGAKVIQLQQVLLQRGYPLMATGSFDSSTFQAVRAFQSQNLDQHGLPLMVDGIVGPLTWWSLTHPKPLIMVPSAVDYQLHPATAHGGSALGRAALAAAIDEIKIGAGEVGGDNLGPSVKKYLAPASLSEGNPWCASFVSWCYLQAVGGDITAMPFPYSPGARNLLAKAKAKGWVQAPGAAYQPVPGDIVVWWRVTLSSWMGHAGLVHSLQDGMLYTIEGNKSPKVQGFSYVFSRMDKLLGFIHVP
jgi:hypothetical protein